MSCFFICTNSNSIFFLTFKPNLNNRKMPEE